MKLVLILLMLVVIAGGFAAYHFGMQQPKEEKIKIDGVVLQTAKEVNDFHFTDNKGKPFSKENLTGRWTMMFFGFTNCGYVCPTSMSALNKMYQVLQQQLPENQLPQVVMVSVDPDRDIVKKMDAFVTGFNPHFIGITSTAKETEALEKQLHITANKIVSQSKPKEYYYDHSAEVLLLNPEGNVQAYLSYPHKPEQMVQDYKLILQAAS